ncbi:MAG: nucleotidyl transferase AbiEii/AbiGii toxin family protein [Planctomycetes bacterium]|nr:nucleotidyl transferase AbiEii/AbiGii toxin family protein [Planctomycetota bacterium]
MSYVHEDPAFGDLLRIVAEQRRLALALVEKDYWVTHALWAVHAQGFDVWFKGGTSLSKGFGLIERFSEDLDLKIEPGHQAQMPRVGSWKSEGPQATAERRTSFEWLATNLRVPGATVRLDGGRAETQAWRTADLHILYPALRAATLPPGMKPYVLLELGNARVMPFVPRPISSFVHDHLAQAGLLAAYDDNRPRAVRCVHPLVTLLEKLDALARKAPRADAEAATYVRHYEDAARIIRALGALPPLPEHGDVRTLAAEMTAQRQLARVPVADDVAFEPSRLGHARQLHRAYVEVGPMFWGPRLSLDEAGTTIRGWIRTSLS